MTTTHTITQSTPVHGQVETLNYTNTNSDVGKLCHYDVKPKTEPFVSWWWCATVFGILPTVILNTLFTKKQLQPTRPKFLPINTMIAHCNINPNTYKVESNMNRQLQPAPNLAPVPVLPMPNVDLNSPIDSKQLTDYVTCKYKIWESAYARDVLLTYQHHVSNDGMEKDNNNIAHEIMTTAIQHQVVHRTIHIPTVVLACRELTPLLEESRRHFICRCDRRLSRSEINYHFGKHMLPKVLNHLVTNTKFTVGPTQINETACEVIYLFLANSHRVLPHMHLMNNYESLDIEYVYEKVRNKVYYTDFKGNEWEIESPLFRKTKSLLAQCLFQFPSPELNSSIAQ